MAEGPCRIGLALSGGAVRGAAHIGVLRVLDRAGLRPSVIAGTSVGAIIGAARAAGRSMDEMELAFSELDWFSLVRTTLRLRRSLMDTRRLGRFLRAKLELSTFDALRIPFAAVACDLYSGEQVPLTLLPHQDCPVVELGTVLQVEPLQKVSLVEGDGILQISVRARGHQLTKGADVEPVIAA